MKNKTRLISNGLMMSKYHYMLWRKWINYCEYFPKDAKPYTVSHPELYVGAKIHARSINGIYTITGFSHPNMMTITCKTWQRFNRGTKTVSRDDFKCFHKPSDKPTSR
jgi:hypothetical protein